MKRAEGSIGPAGAGQRLGVERLPRVAVIGSGDDEHAARAEPLGERLAALGVHLVTGGGAGVMAAVSRGFASVAPRRGQVIGILPAAGEDPLLGPPPGYPNLWVEIPIHTHLPLRAAEGSDARSRNHLNVLSAHVVVALPGSSGTASEVELSLRYARPLVAFLADRAEIPGLPRDVPVEPSLDRVIRFVEAALARVS